MSGGFLGKWFGRPSSPPSSSPALTPDVEEALGELSRLARKKPELAGAAALLREILPRLYENPIRTSFASLTAEQARIKLSAGVPLLQGESFSVDEGTFRQRWEKVCESVQRHQGGDVGRKLQEGLRTGQLNPGQLLGDVLAGRMNVIGTQVASLGLDAGLTFTLLRLLLIPVLGPINAACLGVRQGIRWESGLCPTCGNWPLLGEYRGLQQAVFLRCGLCTAEWGFARRVCPFCGVDDPAFLRSKGAKGQDASYRAFTCDACRGYVKMVVTLLPLTGPRLLVADLASMHLDQSAAENGYAAPE